MRKIVLLLLFLMLFCGCRGAADLPAQGADQKGEVAPGQELTCLVNTQQDALAIARQYGIELVGFEAGVAVFHTEDDWSQIIEQGRKAGWPELSPNYVMELS